MMCPHCQCESGDGPPGCIMCESTRNLEQQRAARHARDEHTLEHELDKDDGHARKFSGSDRLVAASLMLDTTVRQAIERARVELDEHEALTDALKAEVESLEGRLERTKAGIECRNNERDQLLGVVGDLLVIDENIDLLDLDAEQVANVRAALDALRVVFDRVRP